MLPRIISPILILPPRKLIPIIIILSGLVSSCGTTPPIAPTVGMVEPSQTAVADVIIPTQQVLESTPTQQAPESTPAQTGVNGTAEFFSSDQLGLCFSYPQGYTQMPYNDAVEIVAPVLPGSDVAGLFWLDISDSYNRTAEKIADQDMTYAADQSVGRSTMTLGGEQAVVLDGMPGQDLVRRVYIVHQQTLYILTFSPTRSEDKAASDQMEALYAAVTSSWAWSPCSAK